jgi:hypothetical protein
MSEEISGKEMIIQKPKHKKRKPKNNPIPTIDDICMITGKPYAETHEIFFGPHRQKSTKYGLQVKLSKEYHTGDKGPHKNRTFDLELKRRGQMQFEAKFGHDEFMRLFGKNYLE